MPQYTAKTSEELQADILPVSASALESDRFPSDLQSMLFIPSALGAGIRSGLYIYIFKQFFEGMSSALEESAYVDGSFIDLKAS